MIRIRGFELVVATLLSLAAHGGFLVLAGADQQSELVEVPARMVFLDLAAFDDDVDALEPIGAAVADPLAAQIDAMDLEPTPILAPAEQAPEMALTETPALEPMAIAALISHTQDRNLTPPEEPPPPTPDTPKQQPAEFVPPAPNSENRLEPKIVDTARPDAPAEVEAQAPSPAEPPLNALPPPMESAKNPDQKIPDRLSEPDTTLAPETFSTPELPQPTQPITESLQSPAPLLDAKAQQLTVDEQLEITRPQQSKIIPADQTSEPELMAPEIQQNMAKPRIPTPQQTQVVRAAIEPPLKAPAISTTNPIQPVTLVAVATTQPTLVSPSTDRPPPPPRLSEAGTIEPPIAREQTAPVRAPQAAATPVTIAAATPPAAMPRGPSMQAVRKARLSYGEALSLRINRLTRSSYPRWAIRKSVEGWIPVRIRIGPTGEILDLEVLDDTYAPSRLIKAAIKMIRSAAPFEAFSDQMGTGNAIFEVRVNFVLQ